MKTDIITAPSVWSSYLINSDASGLTPEEQEAANAYFAGYTVHTIREDSERFTWHYSLYGGLYHGGEVCDYIVTEAR